MQTETASAEIAEQRQRRSYRKLYTVRASTRKRRRSSDADGGRSGNRPSAGSTQNHAQIVAVEGETAAVDGVGGSDGDARDRRPNRAIPGAQGSHPADGRFLSEDRASTGAVPFQPHGQLARVRGGSVEQAARVEKSEHRPGPLAGKFAKWIVGETSAQSRFSPTAAFFTAKFSCRRNFRSAELRQSG